MGYYFEADKIYDDMESSFYYYNLSGIDLEELKLMNVSLWYDDIVEEAKRCILLLTNGKEFATQDRILQLHGVDTIEEYIKGDARCVKASPFASVIMILSEIEKLYIGYCHNVSVSKPLGNTDGSPVRIQLGRFQSVRIRFGGTVVSLENIRTHMCRGGSIKLANTVLQEFEDGINVVLPEDTASGIDIDAVSTYRNSVDMSLLLDYAGMLGVNDLYLYHTEELTSVDVFLDSVLDDNSELQVFMQDMKNTESAYNSVMNRLKFAEKLSTGKEINWKGDSCIYKGTVYELVMSVKHHYENKSTGIYTYKNRQFLFYNSRGMSGLYVARLYINGRGQ